MPGPMDMDPDALKARLAEAFGEPPPAPAEAETDERLVARVDELEVKARAVQQATSVPGALSDVADALGPLLRTIERATTGALGLEAELARLRDFEAAVRAALQPGRWRGFDGPDGATVGEALDDVAAAVTALDTARGGDR